MSEREEPGRRPDATGEREQRGRIPDAASERLLDELREEAATQGEIARAGARPEGSPMPWPRRESGRPQPGLAPPEVSDLPPPGTDHGYYGQPVIKAPVWTWEVPVYFAVGGAAGVAAVIASVADVAACGLIPTSLAVTAGSGAAGPAGLASLAGHAHLIALAGALLSGLLLVSDLGRPERFLNMLRVFKWRSPMSVGAWTLAVFGAAATLSAAAHFLVPAQSAVADLELAVGAGAALAGLLLATYTGVLLAATVVPAWAGHRALLPVHFGAAGLGSAGALLEILGHMGSITQTIGLVAAGSETLIGLALEWRRHAWDAPLRSGLSGSLLRAGSVLMGPLPLALRLLAAGDGRARMLAAGLFVVGALLSRFGWLEAGRASAADPRATFRWQRSRQAGPE